MDAISLLAHACSETALSSLVDQGSNKDERLQINTDLDREDSNELYIDESGSDNENSENQLDRVDGDDSTDTDKAGNKISSRGNWTIEEDEKLRKAVAEFGGRNWKKIAEQIPERTDVQCLHRWQKVLRPGLIKGPWTAEVR